MQHTEALLRLHFASAAPEKACALAGGEHWSWCCGASCNQCQDRWPSGPLSLATHAGCLMLLEALRMPVFPMCWRLLAPAGTMPPINQHMHLPLRVQYVHWQGREAWSRGWLALLGLLGAA